MAVKKRSELLETLSIVSDARSMASLRKAVAKSLDKIDTIFSIDFMTIASSEFLEGLGFA